MAEGVGFEPTVGLPQRLISSQVPLTTQPPFQPSSVRHLLSQSTAKRQADSTCANAVGRILPMPPDARKHRSVKCARPRLRITHIFGRAHPSRQAAHKSRPPNRSGGASLQSGIGLSLKRSVGLLEYWDFSPPIPLHSGSPIFRGFSGSEPVRPPPTQATRPRFRSGVQAVRQVLESQSSGAFEGARVRSGRKRQRTGPLHDAGALGRRLGSDQLGA